MTFNYLFDVDGTLTEPRKMMDTDFGFFFINWMTHKRVFLVAGSDLEKVNSQIPASIISKCRGIFCCMGNQLWMKDKLIYNHEWKPTTKLLSRLLELRKSSSYPNKKARWIESRQGMLNFSTAGRDSNTRERKNYHEWDKKNGERSRLAETINEEFPHLEACLGGEISLDIQPRGFNKSLASKWVRDNKSGDIIFIGDKTHEGGNDYAIVKDIEANMDGKSYTTTSPTKTRRILERIGR